jgi:cysteine desulfurase
VDETGQVDPERVLSEVSAETGIVHLQWANHEVGTVQPITEVIAGCRARGVLVHIDAAQAAATVPIHFDALGADLLSVSGHKLGAPAGTGALLIRRGLRLDPLLVGGDQERARRAGAENLLGFIGFGAAANELSAELPTIGERLAEFTAQIIRWVTNRPGIEVLGHPADRLPHLVCLATDRIEPQPLLIALDRAGIAVHSGNSCSSEALEPSPVLAAMGVDAHRSLRVSVGWSTRQSDIDRLLIELPAALDALASLRRASDS